MSSTIGDGSGARAPRYLLPSGRDIKEMLLATLLIPVAWVVPERYWPKLCRYFASWSIKRRPHVLRGAPLRFAQAMPDQAKSIDPREIQIDAMTRQFERMLHVLREWGPGSPARDWEFEGREKILAALKDGNGVLLWYLRHGPPLLPFCAALKAAGLDAVQIGRRSHGFANTPFAIRYINRFWCYSENRYMKDRVVIDDENPRAASEALRDELRRGEIVAIAVGGPANRVAEVPFFATRLVVPTGPLKIAADTGAPVFLLVCETMSDGSNVFRAEGPLDLGQAVDGVHHFEPALDQFSAFVQKYVARAPRQWQCWKRKDYLVDEPDVEAGRPNSV